MQTHPPNVIPDTELLDRLKQNDQDAFQLVFEMHHRMVFNVCVRILRNPSDAEDATQATFLVFFKKVNRLGPGTSIGGWLYKTACLISRRHLRDKMRRQQREEAAAMSPFRGESANSEALWEEVKPELDAAIGDLSPTYRNIVVLRYLEGYSTEETARQLGLTPSAVSTNLSRALGKLRARFRRRGITLTSAALATTLSHHVSAAHPSEALRQAVLSTASSGGGAAVLSSTATQMIQGALTHMKWMTLQTIIGVSLAVSTASVAVVLGLSNNGPSAEETQAAGTTAVSSATVHQKLESIILPEVRIEKRSLADALQDLEDLSRKHDPEGTGVSIEIDPELVRVQQDMTPLTMVLKKSSVRNSLDLLTQLLKLSYSVEEDRVVVHP